MTDQSQYLAQVLQQMGQAAPQASGQVPGMSLAQMQKMQQDRATWEVANPGQSYAAHGLGQMGQNLMGAPGNVADAIGGLGELPKQALSGLQALAARFGGTGQAAPY